MANTVEAYFPADERDVYADYLAIRDVLYPEYFEKHSESPVEATDYWDEVREMHEEMGYSSQGFSQLSDIAFQDIRDLKLLNRPNLRYIELQRALFSRG